MPFQHCWYLSWESTITQQQIQRYVLTITFNSIKSFVSFKFTVRTPSVTFFFLRGATSLAVSSSDFLYRYWSSIGGYTFLEAKQDQLIVVRTLYFLYNLFGHTVEVSLFETTVVHTQSLLYSRNILAAPYQHWQISRMPFISTIDPPSIFADLRIRQINRSTAMFLVLIPLLLFLWKCGVTVHFVELPLPEFDE